MDNLIKAIARLIELTQKGVIRWERGDPPDSTATGDRVEVAFLTEYDGKRLRMFRQRSKVEMDQHRFEWFQNPVLQIVDLDGTTLREFPHLVALHDLMDAVEDQISGAGDWIEKLASGG